MKKSDLCKKSTRIPLFIDFDKEFIKQIDEKYCMKEDARMKEAKTTVQKIFNKREIMEKLSTEKKSQAWLIKEQYDENGTQIYLIEMKDNTKLILKHVLALNNYKCVYDQALIEVEVQNLLNQQSDRIPKIIETAKYKDDTIYSLDVLMEDGGIDLNNIKKVENYHMMYFMLETASLIGLLHSQRIFHCDIKRQNFLIGEGVIRLIDFGTVKKFDTEKEYQKTREKGFEMSGTTPLYAPPEYDEKQKVSDIEKLDVYLWGMMFYMLFSEEMTIKILEKDIESYKQDSYKNFLIKVEKNICKNREKVEYLPKIIEIIISTLSFYPEKRPSFLSIREQLKQCEINKKQVIKR